MNAAVRAAIETRIVELDTQITQAMDNLARCRGELTAAQEQHTLARAQVDRLSAEHEELTNALGPEPELPTEEQA
jgi:hypothetical protein